MVYGIDFGTTFTVVSYVGKGHVKYIKFDGSVLLPTEKSGVKNFKRVLLEKTNLEDLRQDDLLNKLVQFFQYIHKRIKQDVKKEISFNCILTVPVRFNDFTRYLIKYAAILADFNVIKLIQEPIAAAISVIKKHRLKNGHYIIYDLGGGTFDATLIKKYNDIYHVLKVEGIENFGGIDIDIYISNKYQISLLEAENFKKDKYIPDLDIILDKTYLLIDKISKNYVIDGLILNGGSSYLKNIEDKYKEKFKIFKEEDLQTLVSRGAALYGKDFIEQSEFLIDVTPFNLGIEVLGDKLEVLIEENSPIPIKKTERFVPVDNNVVINILQGSSLLASECKKLGTLRIESKEPFDVDFILDCDGILTVKVLGEVFVLSDIFK